MVDFEDNLRTLLLGTGAIFFGQIIGNALGLFANIIIVRSLEPEVFGQLGLASTIAGVIATIAVIGIPEGVTRFIGGTDEHNDSEYIAAGFLIVSFFSVISGVIMYVLRGEIAIFFNEPSLSRVLVFFSLFVILSPVSSVGIATLRGLKRAKETAFIKEIVGKLLTLGVLGVFIIVGRPYMGAIFYFVLPPLFVILLTAVTFAVIPTPVSGEIPSRSAIKRLSSYSWPLALEGGIVILMTKSDILMLGYFLDTTQVGYYRAVQPIAIIVTFFIGAIVFLYLPIASKYYDSGEYDKIGALFKTSTKWVSLITLPLVLLLGLFADSIVSTLYSTTYAPAAVALSILSFGLYTRVLSGPNGATIKAINRTKLDLVASVGGLVTNLALNVVLIPQYGIAGAALATAAGFLVFNIIDLCVIYSAIKIHPFRWDTITPLLLTTLIAVGIDSLVSGTDRSVLFIIAVGLLMGVCVVAVTLLTGSIHEDDEVIMDMIEEQTGLNMHRLRIVINKF